jgi:hypothetical protein
VVVERPADSLPDFVIIGAQKAASTTLMWWLSRHDDVWLPPTEDAFFRDPLYSRARLPAFAAQYSGHHERRLGLKCPDYLGRPEVPRRLRRDLHSAQLIVSLRDPIKRAVSAYYWHMRWGMLPIASPEVGLSRILDGEYAEHDRNAVDILEWGLYHRHLSSYLDVFPRDALLIVLDEDLRQDPESVWASTASFLGLDPENHGRPVMSGQVERNPGIYAVPRLRFLRLRTPLVLRRDPDSGYTSIPKPKDPLRRTLSNVVAGTDRYLLRHLFDNRAPALSNTLYGRLAEYYSEDVAALEGLLDRDLSRWLTPTAAVE